MTERVYRIKNKLGLHARPAALLVQTISPFKSKVRIVKDDQDVDGRSIMGIMMLAAEYGCELRVRADGPDEKELLEKIQEIIDRKFDEE